MKILAQTLEGLDKAIDDLEEEITSTRAQSEMSRLHLRRLDLLKQQFEPIELTADLSLKVLWQGTAIACPQLIEPSPPIATQRLVPRHALGEQQSFDRIDNGNGGICWGLLRSRYPWNFRLPCIPTITGILAWS